MPQGLVARWLHWRTGVPYVIHSHSSDLTVFSRFGPIGRAVARSILRKSHAMFFGNRKQKEYAVSLFRAADQVGIKGKAKALPMGVNLEAVFSGNQTTRDARYRIGMISRLTEKKGVDLFIRAADRIAKDGCRVPIGIAGDGEEREKLQSMPSDADIRFIGFVSDAEKARFFNDTEFFVFPSISIGSDVEGMPASLLEALYCGKIIVASRDTNIELLPEWDQIKHHIYFLPDPRNIDAFVAAIKEMLLLDPLELARRSAHLRAVMAHYDWSQLIGSYQSACVIKVEKSPWKTSSKTVVANESQVSVSFTLAMDLKLYQLSLLMTVVNALARSISDPGSTSRPVPPCSTTSGMPVTLPPPLKPG